jgi:hypothetical protein
VRLNSRRRPRGKRTYARRTLRLRNLLILLKRYKRLGTSEKNKMMNEGNKSSRKKRSLRKKRDKLENRGSLKHMKRLIRKRKIRKQRMRDLQRSLKRSGCSDST